MLKKDVLPFIISFLLHVSLFIIAGLIGAGTGYKDGGSGNEKNGAKEGSQFQGVDASTVMEKERPTEVTLYEPPEEKATIIKPKKPKKKVINADEECPDKWYGGIGVMTGFDFKDGLDTIERVFIGYPADLAGLQAGDRIISVSDKQIIGTPGSPIEFTIKRGSQILYFKFNRGKVCY